MTATLTGIDRSQVLFEQIPIFGEPDRFDRRAEDFHFVLFEDPFLFEFEPQVQRRLAAEAEQNKRGALFGDDFFDRGHVERLQIDLIGHVGVGLHGGDVWIHQNSAEPLLFQRLDRLRTE